MLLPGHLAAGYIVTDTILKTLGDDISSADTKMLLVIGTLAGALPDLDLISFFLKNKSLKLQSNESHRTYISHAPLLWVAAGFVIFLASDSIFYETFGLVLMCSTLSHFIFDYNEYGIMWLWPFSKKQYSLVKPKIATYPDDRSLGHFYWKIFTREYLRNKTWYVEIIVIVAALLIYF